MQTNRANFGTALISVIIFWSLSIALLVWGFWSLQQTILFATAASTPTVGPFIGVAVQLGQNLAIFMANKTNNRAEKAAWYGGFAICAVIDAATNIGQYRKEMAPAVDPLVHYVGYGLCILVIFVEEVLAYSFATSLVFTNDLLEAVSGRRFRALEWWAKSAKNFQVGAQSVGRP